MNIFVCIKQVPDTNLTLKVNDDGTGIREEGVEYVTSPYDEHAMEAALQLKEKHGGEVTVLTLGPDRATKALRDALARGCDKAVHIEDAALDGSDCIATARAIAKAMENREYSLILCGKQAVDDDSAAVGQAVAEFLGIAHVTEVEQVESSEDGSSFTIHRAIDGGQEVIESKTPLLLTCQKSLNKPRYASLKGIMKAKRKPIEKLTIGDLGLETSQVGKDGSPTMTAKLETAPEKSVQPKTIDGEPADQAKELVRLLREEAKIV